MPKLQLVPTCDAAIQCDYYKLTQWPAVSPFFRLSGAEGVKAALSFFTAAALSFFFFFSGATGTIARICTTTCRGDCKSERVGCLRTFGGGGVRAWQSTVGGRWLAVDGWRSAVRRPSAVLAVAAAAAAAAAASGASQQANSRARVAIGMMLSLAALLLVVAAVMCCWSCNCDAIEASAAAASASALFGSGGSSRRWRRRRRRV